MKEKVKLGWAQAIVSRGKNKGMLKAKCPPMNTYGSAVWNAIMGYSNPYKVGMGHLLFMNKDVREVYDYIDKCGKHVDLTNMDREGNLLRELNLI